MKKKFKLRLKYIISISLLIILTYFNWREIPIQESYITGVKWVVLGILGGFTTKTVVKAFLKEE